VYNFQVEEKCLGLRGILWEVTAEEELVVDYLGSVNHRVKKLGNVLSLVAFPFGVGDVGGRRVVMAVGEYLELLDEAIVWMHFWSSLFDELYGS
jgi:hypothetical protein